MPELRGQPRGERGSAGDAHLLAENGADSQLEAVPGARDAQARPRFHQPCEQGVALETGVDGQRIGVQIEHAAHSSHNVQQPRRTDKLDPQRQSMRTMRLYLQPSGPAVQHKGSAVGVAVNVFDACDCPLREKPEQRLVVVGWAKAQL